MAYSGRYLPTNPKKYRGNPSQIIYRSLWERKLMVYCDNNDKVLEWGSEEFWIPYRAPDGKPRRYFPDFIIKVNDRITLNKIRSALKKLSNIALHFTIEDDKIQKQLHLIFD